MKSKFFLIGIVLATLIAMLVPSAVAATANLGPIQYEWITYDNGMNGLWATEYFNSQVTITNLGGHQYRVVFVENGSFVTMDGNSPGGHGLVSAGITGKVTGGISLIVKGYLKEGIPSHVGPIDYRSGGGWKNYLSPFFTDFKIVEFESWGWSFETCGNGTWIDNETTEALYKSQGPNDVMGDVLGTPVACASNEAKPVVTGLWAYVNPGAEDVSARGNICYLLSKTRPSQSEADNDVRRLCFTKSSPEWWDGAFLLTHGDVYDNGTQFGYWDGDATVSSFSSAPRLPLYGPGPNLLDKAKSWFPWTQK